MFNEKEFGTGTGTGQLANVNPADLAPKEPAPEVSAGDAAMAYFQEWSKAVQDRLAVAGYYAVLPDTNPVLMNALQYLRDRHVPEGRRVTQQIQFPGGDRLPAGSYVNDFFEWSAKSDGTLLPTPYRCGTWLLAANPEPTYQDLKDLGVIDPAFIR